MGVSIFCNFIGLSFLQALGLFFGPMFGMGNSFTYHTWITSLQPSSTLPNNYPLPHFPFCPRFSDVLSLQFSCYQLELCCRKEPEGNSKDLALYTVLMSCLKNREVVMWKARTLEVFSDQKRQTQVKQVDSLVTQAEATCTFSIWRFRLMFRPCGSYINSRVSTLQTLRGPVDLCRHSSLLITPCFQDLFKNCQCFSSKCVLSQSTSSLRKVCKQQ